MTALDRLNRLAESLTDVVEITDTGLDRTLSCGVLGSHDDIATWTPRNTARLLGARVVDRVLHDPSIDILDAVLGVMHDAAQLGANPNARDLDRWVHTLSDEGRRVASGEAGLFAREVLLVAEAGGVDVIAADVGFLGLSGFMQLRSRGNVLVRDRVTLDVGLLHVERDLRVLSDIPVVARFAALVAACDEDAIGFLLIAWPTDTVIYRTDVNDDVLMASVLDIEAFLATDLSSRTPGPWCVACPEAATCPATHQQGEQK